MTHLIAKGMTALLLALLGMVCVLWVWSGHNSSLALVLTHLPEWLPPGQTLTAHNIHGSVREGGTIGELRWRANGLTVQAFDVRIGYSLSKLLQRQLELTELRIGQLRVNDQSDKPAERRPPENLVLPLHVSLKAQVDRLFLQQATTPLATDIAFTYRFDGKQHMINKGLVNIAAGSYGFNGHVQAQDELRVEMQAQGRIKAHIAGAKQPQLLTATATLTGALFRSDSTLQLQAALHSSGSVAPAAKSLTKTDAQLSLSATLAPWQLQPIAKAQANWKALDLALLWPQAPQTNLSGELVVTPMPATNGARWAARIGLHNSQPGPMNQQGLPLQNLSAQFEYQDPRWLLRDFQLEAAGGHITGSGRYDGTGWRVEAKVENLSPEQVDSRWMGGAIHGHIKGQQSAQGLAFETDLRANTWSGRTDASAWPVHLQALQSKGLWAEPELKLEHFSAKVSEASLQGSGRYHSQNHAVQATLDLQLPGLEASVKGTAAADSGGGHLSVLVTDAQRSADWLGRWPALAKVLDQGKLHGNAQITGRWAGGWGKDLHGPQFDLAMESSLLQWQPKGTVTKAQTQLRALRAHAAGSLDQFKVESQGRADVGSQQLQWRTQGLAKVVNSKALQAAVSELKVTWQKSTNTPEWSLQLAPEKNANDPQLQLNWRLDSDKQALLVSGWRAQLSGPLPGEVTLQWHPAHWTQTGTGQASWASSGQLLGLPLSWLDAWSPKPMAELGLSSDLMLQGQWDLSQSDTLRLQASLERSSGDLQLNTGDSRQPVLPADLREASLRVDLNQRQLATSLRWDSSRAGKALVALSTTLGSSDGLWQWRDDAPVGASVQLQSPPAQAWTALAPPGWRLRGVVDADIVLSGTRAVPVWSGKLRARDLAVRSVLQGLDFERGFLDATLSGQKLTIEQATLYGAGASGGSLNVNGSIDWITDSKVSSVAAHTRMALATDIKALRVSVRPDRRMTASGKIDATFDGAELRLNGALVADHALITLPDNATPALGADVEIRQPDNAKRPSLTRSTPETAPSPVAFKLRVELDPGADFQVRGRGLQGRLAGKLVLQSQGAGTTLLSGTLRTEAGTYQAYGQRLNIEQGTMLFTGAIDNPTLDILAIRPQLTQRVGVQVSGTALTPVVRLYAEPDLPDAEKLSWLLLGRSSGNGGAEAALLQQAAMVMIGNRRKGPSTTLAQTIGLDELSVQGKSTTAGGEIDSATVTLGKRLTKDIYVAYEHSLAGTVGAFSIFYDLSNRFAVRAQTGEQSAVDLIFTLRYD